MNMPIQSSTKIFPTTLLFEHQDNNDFYLETQRYLKNYPETRFIDICLHDLNGHIRGKRIEVNALHSLQKGCYFPLSIYAMNLNGQVVEESGLGKYIGEPDRLCMPVLGSLKSCADHPTQHAQLLLSMQSDDGSDCMLEPRNLLKKILTTLHQIHYFPVIAGEIEFYLSSQQEHAKTPQTQCFDVDTPHDFHRILQQIEQEAKRQNIDLTAIVAESASGQFELNIQHSHNILKLCDDIMAIKRMIRQIAVKHHLQASFMAKPNMSKAGSGMHFHMSILNQYQNNIFRLDSSKYPNTVMQKIIAGLIDLMPASMAILAPNVNSFRRFQFGQHVPLEANWGLNNRNVAIRIPCADQDNQRLEYRVAGADVNPYLCVATILAGVLHGLHAPLDLAQTNAKLNILNIQHSLPIHQLEALQLFEKSCIFKQYFGTEFMQLWCACKRFEYQTVINKITQTELDWGI
ncbi:glutamine synthetase family protein [Acinetobacter nematophilus]|uniref:Glutamine synthetase family protein n=1 Tax=Acinetobacter nematophilus TaxID=2994642 RepID=A0A9X3IHD5_9GAMM|nr:glutamine synthetase family protein [Acinetobacter nematophilus]MCX5468682.1 glutamine synthetase family protein [Acinetobacter nematophilus]